MYLLFDTARKFGQSPGYYAFGASIPLQAQFEIDAYVNMIGTAYETELKEEATEKAKTQSGESL